MLKNVTQLEHVVGGKLYHFTCDSDSPLPHVKDALNKFIQYVCQIEDQIAAQQKEVEEKAKAEGQQKSDKIEELPKEG